jgi:hypothetical protein
MGDNREKASSTAHLSTSFLSSCVICHLCTATPHLRVFSGTRSSSERLLTSRPSDTAAAGPLVYNVLLPAIRG